MFKSGKYDLSDDIARKYGLLGASSASDASKKGEELDEEDNDEDYTYEYVDEDEEEEELSDISDDCEDQRKEKEKDDKKKKEEEEKAKKKDIEEAEEKRRKKAEEDRKKQKEAEEKKKKDEEDCKRKKEVEEKKKTKEKERQKEDLKKKKEELSKKGTSEKPAEKAKAESKTKSAEKPKNETELKPRRMESESPVRQWQSGRDGGKIDAKPDATKKAAALAPPAKSRAKSVVIDEKRNIEVTPSGDIIKAAVSTDQLARNSDSKSNVKPTTTAPLKKLADNSYAPMLIIPQGKPVVPPPLPRSASRPSRVNIPERSTAITKALWEKKVEDEIKPPPVARANIEMLRDPWLCCASQAAEIVRENARSNSVGPASGRLAMRFGSIPATSQSAGGDDKGGQPAMSAREKIMAQMQQYAHIAPKPVFAVAAIKPKPKPPLPPPPPPKLPPKEEPVKGKQVTDNGSKQAASKTSVKKAADKTSAKPATKPEVAKKPDTKTPAKKVDKSKEADAKKQKEADDKKKKEEVEAKKKKEAEEKKEKDAAEEKKKEDEKQKAKSDKSKEEELDDEEYDDEDWEYEYEDEDENEEEMEKDEKEKEKNKEKEEKDDDKDTGGPEDKVDDKDIDKEEVDEEEMEEVKKTKRRRRLQRRVIVRRCPIKRVAKKPPSESEGPKKRRWVAPPRPPPEPIEMPPQIQHLYEVLKMEGIAPTKRYAKKAKTEVAIPFVIPWEQAASLESQAGMGAFGTHRDPKINITDGNLTFVQGELKSENILPLFEENVKKFASQKGLTSFGSHRRNVDNIVDHHVYDSEDKKAISETIIPKIALGSLVDQRNMTPFGAYRTQTAKVEYSKGMKKGCDAESNTFLSRQFKPNSAEKAGSRIIDCRRPIVQSIEGAQRSDRTSDSIVPRIFSNDLIHTKSGSNFGAFRPLVHESSGGYKMTRDEEILCKLVVPYQTAPSLPT